MKMVKAEKRSSILILLVYVLLLVERHGIAVSPKSIIAY